MNTFIHSQNTKHPLCRWRESVGKSREHFARDLSNYGRAKGLTASIHSVGRWERGERMPRPRMMALIHEFTAGAVGADDFLNPVGINPPTVTRRAA